MHRLPDAASPRGATPGEHGQVTRPDRLPDTGRDRAGEQLIQAMTSTPAAEYLLIEADGDVYGILTSADVERAFASGP